MSFDDDFVDRNDTALVDKEIKENSKQVQRGKTANAVIDFFKTIIFLIVLPIACVVIITIIKPGGLVSALRTYIDTVGYCLVPTMIVWPIGLFCIKILLKRQFKPGILPIAFFGPFLVTALLVILIGTESPLASDPAKIKTSVEINFIAAYFVSILSLLFASRKVGAKN